MHKLLRFYNQNRLKVWVTILFIVFVLIIIQLLNRMALNSRNERNVNNQNTATSTSEKTYENESVSIASGGSVATRNQEKFGSLIDEFFTYCINHEPEKAYGLLSTDIKENIYQTENLFEKLYYETKFEGNKQYSFQSWSTGRNAYIYIVKIFDNMLATGKSSDDEYIEDYIAIAEEDNGAYSLNVGGFIAIQDINKEGSNEKISIGVEKAEIHMDYATYTLNIKNNTDQTILLNEKSKTDTVYLLDENDVKYTAFLYENTDEEFTINPQESKTIQIKFNVTHRDNLVMKNMVFEAIVIGGQENEERIAIDIGV